MDKPNGKVLKIIRYFDASPELVWQAWKDPEIFMKWWGPRLFTCPYCVIDFRQGGKFLISMRSDEGEEFWSTGTYLEIIEQQKIIATDSFADKEGNIVPAAVYGLPHEFPLEMLVTIHFEEDKGRTRFTLEHSLIPEGELYQSTQSGWSESFDKLSEVLIEMQELVHIKH